MGWFRSKRKMSCKTVEFKSRTWDILFILLFLLFHFDLFRLSKDLFSVWTSAKSWLLGIKKKVNWKRFLFDFTDVSINVIHVKRLINSYRSEEIIIKLILILWKQILNLLEEDFIVVIQYFHFVTLMIF